MNGDVIFCNSTCFTKELFADLCIMFNELKIGSFLISLTKAMTSEKFELIYETKEIEYSWGNPTTRIYKKIY